MMRSRATRKRPSLFGRIAKKTQKKNSALFTSHGCLDTFWILPVSVSCYLSFEAKKLKLNRKKFERQRRDQRLHEMY